VVEIVVILRSDVLELIKLNLFPGNSDVSTNVNEPLLHGEQMTEQSEAGKNDFLQDVSDDLEGDQNCATDYRSIKDLNKPETVGAFLGEPTTQQIGNVSDKTPEGKEMYLIWIK
jgi:hypothetical protein